MIFEPFKAKLKTSRIIIITAIIIICAVALQLHSALKRVSFTQKLVFVNNNTVNAHICSDGEAKFISLIIQYSIGLWIPAILLLVLHFVMYRKLRQEAQARMQMCTSDSSEQMKIILRTFTIIVITYNICLLPYSFVSVTRAYLLDFNQSTFLSYANLFTTLSYVLGRLTNLNSCINPLIYGQVHLKIYSVMKSAWRFVVDGVRKVIFGNSADEGHGNSTNIENSLPCRHGASVVTLESRL